MLHLKEDVQNCAKTSTRRCYPSSDDRQYNLALCTNCDPIKLATNGSHYSTLNIFMSARQNWTPNGREIRQMKKNSLNYILSREKYVEPGGDQTRATFANRHEWSYGVSLKFWPIWNGYALPLLWKMWFARYTEKWTVVR